MGQRLNKEYAGYSESGGEEGGLTSDSEILGPPFLHLEAVRIQLRKKKKDPACLCGVGSTSRWPGYVPTIKTTCYQP